MVVDVTVQRGHDVRRLRLRPAARVRSEFSGWVFGSLMMPTLAQRVWPRIATRASGDCSARRSSASARQRRAKRCGVVAELTDLGGSLVHERQAIVGLARRRRTGTAGRCRARRAASAAAAASMSWPQTNTWRPAESRPRTSSRSIAAERLLHGEIAGRAPTAAHRARRATRPPRCERSRSWRTAHRTSLRSINSALARSSASASSRRRWRRDRARSSAPNASSRSSRAVDRRHQCRRADRRAPGPRGSPRSAWSTAPTRRRSRRSRAGRVAERGVAARRSAQPAVGRGPASAAG